MHLTMHEQERLLIHVAADVAAKRRDRGLLLNYPEAMALLTAHALEAARDGKSVSDIMDSGRQLLTRADLMTGVPEMIEVLQVEATFPDGTKLVTIHDPIPDAVVKSQGGGVHPGKIEHPQERKAHCPVGCEAPDANACCDVCDDAAAWHESIFFNVQNEEDQGEQPGMKPITVKNTSDRPIQVGSHYHFAEVNPGLEQVVTTDTSVTYKPLLESTEAKGRRLNIAAGKSVRFEPGDVCRVELVDIEGFVKSKSKSKSKGTDAEPATEEILGLRKGNV